MSTILSIQSSARSEGSFSRDLSAELISKLNASGAHKIVNRDCSETIPHLSGAFLAADFTPQDQRSQIQRETLKVSDDLVAELMAADILVIGAPIYNFSVPAALKAWIDMVCRAGQTFAYTENGPKGLIEGKKAYLVIASGGVPIDSPVDFATPYLRHVLGFLGITDVEVVGAEGMAYNPDAGLAKARAAIEKAAA
ncbi:MAG: NAD(P)H-dependent oxidoreductase [Ahrensia sp.]|nr:NAD(P)H-dependent oxidoreductase [Ahrensia sp.]